MLPFDFEHAPVFRGRTKAVGEVLDAPENRRARKGRSYWFWEPAVLERVPGSSWRSSSFDGDRKMVGDGPWRVL